MKIENYEKATELIEHKQTLIAYLNELDDFLANGDAIFVRLVFPYGGNINLYKSAVDAAGIVKDYRQTLVDAIRMNEEAFDAL